MYKRLLLYLKHQQNVEMIYINGDTNVTKRIVRLYEVNEQEIIGYCYLRGNVRRFKLEQILAVIPVQNCRSNKPMTS